MSVVKEKSSLERLAALGNISNEIEREKATITKARRRRKIVTVVAKHGLTYALKDGLIRNLFSNKRNRARKFQKISTKDIIWNRQCLLMLIPE